MVTAHNMCVDVSTSVEGVVRAADDFRIECYGAATKIKVAIGDANRAIETKDDASTVSPCWYKG